MSNIPFEYSVMEYSSVADSITADNEGFIDQVKPGAISAYKKHNILPSLTLAQAILESNWGKSAPGNMLFGIKWTENCGYDRQLLWTREYVDGEWIRVQAYFRKYDSYEESILDHSKLLLASRYSRVLAAEDYKEACRAVWEAGYATDPDYPKKLISLIEINNLNQWDRGGYKMFNDFDKVSDWAKSDIEEMAEAGIIKGDDQGNFKPKNYIAREEAAVMINRVRKLTNS